MQTIECLVYYQHMSLKFLEFGTSNDSKFLFGGCFQVGITNVCCSKFKAVELCNEGNKADASEGHNTGVDTVKGLVCQIFICH